MSRVYISSCSKPLALVAKSELEDAGHSVVSTWHNSEFKRTAERSHDEMTASAENDINEVIEADILFLIVLPDLSPGGIYVEAGAAIAVGNPVIAVGYRQDGTRGNSMLYHPDVHQFLDMTDAANAVQAIDDEDFDSDDVDDELGFPDDDDVDYEDDEEDDDEDLTVDECGSVITTDDAALITIAAEDVSFII